MNEKITIENYKNPDYEGNSSKYWTGKECIVKDCSKPAGTAWSPYWCFKHNVERMDNISNQLEELIRK